MSKRVSSTPKDLTTPSYWNNIWISTSGNLSNRLQQISYRRKVYNRKKIFGQLLSLTGLKEATLLEIGCAPGVILELIHELKPNYILHGVDYAPAGVVISQSRLMSRGISATIIESDVRTFAPMQQFDIVLSHGFIEHFDNPLEMLQHHVRLTKPNGFVVVSMPNYSNKLVRYFIERFDPDALTTHNLATMDKLILFDLMQKAGLRHIEVGSAGGANLRTVCAKPSISAFLYILTARGWNFSCAPFLGQILWRSVIWGIGQA